MDKNSLTYNEATVLTQCRNRMDGLTRKFKVGAVRKRIDVYMNEEQFEEALNGLVRRGIVSLDKGIGTINPHRNY